MACLNSLKQDIRALEASFPKNHERFQVVAASEIRGGDHAKPNGPAWSGSGLGRIGDCFGLHPRRDVVIGASTGHGYYSSGGL
ncbi:hypothetical protein MRX96_024414 [Rhipicephalus microplus]